MKLFSTLLQLAALSVILMQCTKETTPKSETDKDPKSRLRHGNERFYSGQSLHPDISMARVKSLANEQHPFAIIISCSDSRAPDEIIFDQGLGDLFVIRTAGNVMADIGLGSIEYATQHLNVEYILVMGHEQCGAVKAFAGNLHPDNHINSILDTLMNEVEIKSVIPATDETAYVSELVKANVVHQMNKIIHSSRQTEQQVASGKLRVEGAVYDVSNGKVVFLKN